MPKKKPSPMPKRDEPLSLYGLTPEQAIRAAFNTPPLKKKPATRTPKKPAK